MSDAPGENKPAAKTDSVPKATTPPPTPPKQQETSGAMSDPHGKLVTSNSESPLKQKENSELKENPTVPKPPKKPTDVSDRVNTPAPVMKSKAKSKSKDKISDKEMGKTESSKEKDIAKQPTVKTEKPKDKVSEKEKTAKSEKSTEKSSNSSSAKPNEKTTNEPSTPPNNSARESAASNEKQKSSAAPTEKPKEPAAPPSEKTNEQAAPPSEKSKEKSEPLSEKSKEPSAPTEKPKEPSAPSEKPKELETSNDKSTGRETVSKPNEKEPDSVKPQSSESSKDDTSKSGSIKLERLDFLGPSTTPATPEAQAYDNDLGILEQPIKMTSPEPPSIPASQTTRLHVTERDLAENIVFETQMKNFQPDLLSAYSQSTGTFSYESVREAKLPDMAKRPTRNYTFDTNALKTLKEVRMIQGGSKVRMVSSAMFPTIISKMQERGLTGKSKKQEQKVFCKKHPREEQAIELMVQNMNEFLYSNRDGVFEACYTMDKEVVNSLNIQMCDNGIIRDKFGSVTRKSVERQLGGPEGLTEEDTINIDIERMDAKIKALRDRLSAVTFKNRSWTRPFYSLSWKP